MNDIDAIVNDNPYPGLGNGNLRTGYGWAGYYSYQPRNRWIGRVFSPYTVSENTTVSTLTLEGLAYLPPVMVNDVRFYSRRTPTAQWKRLDYDSGRYAFCAVDVSDYFDICRVFADRPRGSGDSSLVTLAYLFEDGNHKNWGEIDPIDFQDKINEIIGEKTLVSLADYNLALKSHSCDLKSPFAEYIEQNGANGFYNDVRSTDKTNPEYLKYAIQRFVVDGHSELSREEWFENHASNAGNANANNPFDLQDLDISKKENQPFPELLNSDAENRNDYSAGQICDVSTEFLNSRLKQINPCEAIALYDYLDRDSIPASVAVPTVERTPMIVGVEIDADSDLKVEIIEEEGDVSEQTVDGVKTTTKSVTYYPKFTGKINVNTGYAFPFKYRKELNANAGDFSAEAVAYMYAIPEGDAVGENRKCRIPIGGVMKKWPDSGNGGVAFRDGLFSISSRKMTTKLPTNVDEAEDAVSKSGGTFHDVQLEFSGFDNTEGNLKSDGFIARFFLRKREQMQNGVWIAISQGVDGWELDPQKNGGRPEFKLAALDFRSGQLKAIEFGKAYRWGLSLAVRLYDKNQNLVDMAPAHINDDIDSPSGDFRMWLGSLDRPVLRFEGTRDSGFAVEEGIAGYEALMQKKAEMQGGKKVIEEKTYLTDDPRYNYAAENWYEVSTASGSLGEAWLGQVSCGGNDNLKDGDIFMSVSNQGYLQDPGELAFLPRVCGFNPGGDSEMKPVQNAATGVIPTGRDDVANKKQMWRTYGCFGDLGDDEVDNLRLVSPVKGFRVNPFTDDEMVRLAPFLNTPYDWWAAGTNRTDSVKNSMIDIDGKTSKPEVSLKYSFGEHGVEAKVEFQRMEELARKVSDALRSGGSDWYNTWKELDWVGESGPRTICGVDLGRTLHDVDRKFLCSYWRKCYANAQQLFIVFFRAEPVILGGGSGDGNTPAQLGARGVAVVWREPMRPNGVGEDVPHRMRVLFYRQFD